MIKLSIIIPLYNTPYDLIKKCLDTCTGYKDCEVILVDDGSSVDYTSVVKDYDIKYLKTTNGGCGHARNIGIKEARGEYITFLDSDDTIILSKELLDYLNKYDIYLTRSHILEEKTRDNKSIFGNELIDKNLLFRDMFIINGRSIECIEPVWAKFYKREFLLKNGLFFNEALRRGEDVIFNYEAYLKSDGVFHLNKFTYDYLATNESVTRSFDSIMDVTTFQLIKEFEILFNREGSINEYYKDYVARLVVRLMRKYYPFLNKEEYYTRVQELFNNELLYKYICNMDLEEMDELKRELFIILLNKDSDELYSYLRNVCDKKLLKK